MSYFLFFALLKVGSAEFNSKTVQSVIAEHHSDVQACYESMLARQKKPTEGSLKVAFVVGPKGTVKKARVLKTSSLKNRKLSACVVEVLNRLVFSPPTDKRDHPIEYPFNLKAEK